MQISNYRSLNQQPFSVLQLYVYSQCSRNTVLSSRLAQSDFLREARGFWRKSGRFREHGVRMELDSNLESGLVGSLLITLVLGVVR